MLTRFNSCKDINTVASDAIHSYIADGYKIDAKESVIDPNKDKDCTFKAVLKRDVDGIECKAVITMSESGDDNNKAATYRKVETVGDTKWSEEARTFSSSTDKTKLNSAVKNHVLDNICRTPRMWWDHADDDFVDHYHDVVRKIFKDFGLHCDWFGDEFSSRRKRLADANKAPKDNKKTPTDNESSEDKKGTKWGCKCPSAYQSTDNKKEDHIKVNKDDTLTDIYNKIVAKNNDSTDKKNSTESLHEKNKADDNEIDAIVDKVKAMRAYNLKAKEDNLPQQDVDDDLEDSLIKLVRYIFGK